MKFEGAVTIQAPRVKTWAFLTNPDAVSLCAPGLKSVEILIPDKKFKAVAAVGFGAVSATFSNDIEFVELTAPERAVVSVHGTAPGSAVDVIAEMHLEESGENETLLEWTADITISGSIASLATRMMGGVTRKLTEVFFACVKSRIEG